MKWVASPPSGFRCFCMRVSKRFRGLAFRRTPLVGRKDSLSVNFFHQFSSRFASPNRRRYSDWCKVDGNPRHNHNVFDDGRITDASSTTSSVTSDSGSEGTHGGGAGGSFVPEVVRYASSMRLTFKIRDGEPEKIYPPILEVQPWKSLHSHVSSVISWRFCS